MSRLQNHSCCISVMKHGTHLRPSRTASSQRSPLNTPHPAIFPHTMDDSGKHGSPLQPLTSDSGRSLRDFVNSPDQCLGVFLVCNLSNLLCYYMLVNQMAILGRGQNTRLPYPMPILVAFSWIGKSGRSVDCCGNVRVRYPSCQILISCEAKCVGSWVKVMRFIRCYAMLY